jgi:hypothetical protein
MTKVPFRPVYPSTVYYFSTDGNDSNSGLDASHPWQTMTKFNTERAAGTFSGYKAVLFKRGQTWTNGTTLTTLPLGDSALARCHIGAYGEGAIPFINVGIRTNNYLDIRDVKMGYEGYAWGRANTHDMRVVDCVLTGGPTPALDQYASGIVTYYSCYFYNCEFTNVTFLNDPANLTRAGLTVVNYGLATQEMHHNSWNDCLFTTGQRGLEIYCQVPDNNTDYVQPFQYFDFLGCEFEETGGQTVSFGTTCADAVKQHAVDGTAHTAAGQNGYCRFENNILRGAGTRAHDGSLNALCEMSSAIHMSVKRNVMYSGDYGGAFLTQTNSAYTKWRHTHGANCTATRGDGTDVNYCWPKYRKDAGEYWYLAAGLSGDVPNYNEIEDNEFYGQASPYSNIQLCGSHWVYNRNILIRQYVNHDIWNARHASLNGNTWQTVSDASLTPSTTKRALTIEDSDDITMTGETFDSDANYGIVIGTTDGNSQYAAPIGPATNLVFNGNTYNHHSRAYDVWVAAGSSASGTDEAHIHRA